MCVCVWGGVFWKGKIQSSAKICLNLNWGGGGDGVLESQNPKCQDLPKFQFGGGGFWKVKTQSAKICLNLNGGRLENQNPKCQDLPKFKFGGGCSGESKPKVPRSA